MSHANRAAGAAPADAAEPRRGIEIAGRAFCPRSPLAIAELGTSHGGDLPKALEMLAAAAEAGAGCAKLQIVIADEILHPSTGEVPLPGGPARLYDIFRALEAPPEFYAAVKERAEALGMLFLCTPFGLGSARILRSLGPSAAKVASPELNHAELLREIAGWRLPTFLSCGVSTLGDIEEALAIVRGEAAPLSGGAAPLSGGAAPLSGGAAPWAASPCLLHCVTAYPAPEEEYNLRVLGSLAAIFGAPVGASDHSMDPELVPALAVAQGACAVEKHFCLSRRDPGLDDPIALPPGDFARMAAAMRRAAEEGPERAIARISLERGAEKVRAILGSGAKALAPSERASYGRTNRSLHALRDIPPGQAIAPGDFAALRTEKVLRPGLPPSWAPLVAGRTARQRIPAGEGIRFEDI